MKWIDPNSTFDCTNSFFKKLPNTQFDQDCLGDNKYPISLDISLPTEPHDAFVVADDNTAGIVLDSVRVRAMRTDTNKVIMDFILEGLEANISLSLNDMWYLDFHYNIKLSDVKIVEKGALVKAERDVWQLSSQLNSFTGYVQDTIDQHSFRYTLYITNRKVEVVWDEGTKAFFVGLTPDPVFIGFDQFQPFY